MPTILRSSKRGGEELRILSPVFNKLSCQECHKSQEKILGVIEVRLDMKTLEENLRQSTKIIAVMSSFILLLVLGIVVYLLKRSVLDRISNLLGWVSRTSEGNYNEKIEDPRSDELGILTRAFDEMRERIREHTSDLSTKITELTRRLTNLHILSETISSTVDVVPGLKELVDLIKDWLHSEVCNIYLFDGKVLKLQASSEPGKAKGEVQIGEGIIGLVAKEKKPIWRDEFEMKEGSSSSVLAIPLISQDKLVGVMEVWRRQRFIGSDFSLLSIISNQVAAALENRRLFKELQSKKNLLDLLFERATSAQEEERKRIAMELHDEIGQILNLMMIHLDSVEEAIPGSLKEVREKVGGLKSLTTRTLDDIHHLIYRLRPTLLDDLGLIPAIRWYAKNYLESLGIKVQMTFVDLERRLPSQVEVALFRIIQEAFTNTLRHAEAKNVTLHLELKDSTVTAFIADDGKGFDINKVLKPPYKVSALGLQGIEERVTLLGGLLQITSQPGKGTQLLIEFPLKEDLNGKDTGTDS